MKRMLVATTIVLAMVIMVSAASAKADIQLRGHRSYGSGPVRQRVGLEYHQRIGFSIPGGGIRVGYPGPPRWG